MESFEGHRWGWESLATAVEMCMLLILDKRRSPPKKTHTQTYEADLVSGPSGPTLAFWSIPNMFYVVVLFIFVYPTCIYIYIYVYIYIIWAFVEGTLFGVGKKDIHAWGSESSNMTHPCVAL